MPELLPPSADVEAPVAAPEPLDGTPAEQRRGVSRRVIFWSVALSLAAIGIVSFATKLDVTDLALFVRRLHPGMIGGALLMLVLRVHFGALRLKAVSSGRLSYRQALRGQLAWDFFSNVTPATVGGGPFAAAYVAHDLRARLGEGVAILLFAMLVEQAWTATSALLILAALPFWPVFPHALGPIGVGVLAVYCVVMLAWTVVMAWALLRRPDWIEKGVRLVVRLPLLRRFEARARREVAHLHERAVTLRGRPFGFYVRAYFFSAGSWVARYAMLVFLVWAVVPDAPGGLVFLRHMALTLGGMVLPTPGGAGGLEGFFALFIGPLIQPAALIAPVLLVWRVLGFYLFLLAGLPLSLHSAKAGRARP
jgi:glycosyltransferase 2 family protein